MTAGDLTRRRLPSGARRGAALLAVIAACLTAAAMAGAETPPPSSAATPGDAISAAEQLLFTHAHLATVRTPRTLSYAYSAETAASAAPGDHATLALRPRPNGSCCSVHGEYLSGAMAVHLPDFDDATANPILLYFLESEVRRLQRTTQGQAAHFRRQIRLSLATTARVTDATVRWNGKDVPGQAVLVAPFVDDPYRARFEREAATQYVFLLSDQVPGGVASMSATLPDPGGAGKPAERRRLVLEDPQPAAPAQP